MLGGRGPASGATAAVGVRCAGAIGAHGHPFFGGRGPRPAQPLVGKLPVSIPAGVAVAVAGNASLRRVGHPARGRRQSRPAVSLLGIRFFQCPIRVFCPRHGQQLRVGDGSNAQQDGREGQTFHQWGTKGLRRARNFLPIKMLGRDPRKRPPCWGSRNGAKNRNLRKQQNVVPSGVETPLPLPADYSFRGVAGMLRLRSARRSASAGRTC